MTDKRLEEIKDSIDLQLLVASSVNCTDEIAEEEKELYEYVILLRKQVKELEEKLHNILQEVSNEKN